MKVIHYQNFELASPKNNILLHNHSIIILPKKILIPWYLISYVLRFYSLFWEGEHDLLKVYRLHENVIFSVLKFTVVLWHTPFFSLFDTENPGDFFRKVLFVFLVKWEFMCKGWTRFRVNIFGKTPSVVYISYLVINRCVIISCCLTVSDTRSFDLCLHQLLHWALQKVDFPNRQLYICLAKEEFSVVNWKKNNYYQSKDWYSSQLQWQ